MSYKELGDPSVRYIYVPSLGKYFAIVEGNKHPIEVILDQQSLSKIDPGNIGYLYLQNT